jgi:mRNA interferase MazF
LVDAPLLRVTVEPDERNGLSKRSQVMVDKPQTPTRTRVGSVIGHLDDTSMVAISRALAIVLGLA